MIGNLFISLCGLNAGSVKFLGLLLLAFLKHEVRHDKDQLDCEGHDQEDVANTAGTGERLGLLLAPWLPGVTILHVHLDSVDAVPHLIEDSGDTAYISTVLNEVRDSINRVKMDMQNGYARRPGGQQQSQPLSCPSCVSNIFLVVALAVQLVLIMAYLMFKESKEQQAKKFY